jgi:hypothetical protein
MGAQMADASYVNISDIDFADRDDAMNALQRIGTDEGDDYFIEGNNWINECKGKHMIADNDLWLGGCV